MQLVLQDELEELVQPVLLDQQEGLDLLVQRVNVAEMEKLASQVGLGLLVEQETLEQLDREVSQVSIVVA